MCIDGGEPGTRCGFAYRLAPDAMGSFGDELQLGPLIFFGEEISFGGRGEAALRAESQIFERDVFRGFVDAMGEFVGIFEARDFAADQAENDRFAARDETKRREGTGTLVVVFE